MKVITWFISGKERSNIFLWLQGGIHLIKTRLDIARVIKVEEKNDKKEEKEEEDEEEEEEKTEEDI